MRERLIIQGVVPGQSVGLRHHHIIRDREVAGRADVRRGRRRPAARPSASATKPPPPGSRATRAWRSSSFFTVGVSGGFALEKRVAISQSISSSDSDSTHSFLTFYSIGIGWGLKYDGFMAQAHPAKF